MALNKKESFAELFLRARTQLGITQAEMADRLGYGSQTRISEIENGKRNPSRAVIILLKKILNEK